ncbi:MAG: metallophosphoesterase [Arenicella sp.]|nr:metallophosphoesterase [Arenicella sp.]
MITRRQMLRYLGSAALSLSGIGLCVYTYQRGIRLPTLHWDPLALNTQFNIQGLEQAIGADLIQTPLSEASDEKNVTARFRAFAPEPSLILRSEKPSKIRISVSNIASEAVLNYSPSDLKISETSSNTKRTLRFETASSSEISLQWRLPEYGDYTFASIGDTGGDKELNWCIERAHALGAKFFLHLGDFNYQEGDYQRSIDAFNNAPMPVYVSIGNHDHHNNGAIYQRFMDEIGPLNNVFTIGKTRFVNIDTAANILPYGAGQRGELLDLLSADNNYTDTVAFTHRPLHDPSEGSHHDIGSTGERDWLVASLKKINAKTLLSGHIHIYHRSKFDGIDNIIAGQGLGHQDLLINGDASKIVLGHVDKSGAVRYTAEPLAMPMEAHCHPRIDPVKDSLRDGEHQAILKVLEKACKD